MKLIKNLAIRFSRPNLGGIKWRKTDGKTTYERSPHRLSLHVHVANVTFSDVKLMKRWVIIYRVCKRMCVCVCVYLMAKLNNSNSLLNKENQPADIDEGVFFINVRGLRASMGEACVAR